MSPPIDDADEHTAIEEIPSDTPSTTTTNSTASTSTEGSGAVVGIAAGIVGAVAGNNSTVSTIAGFVGTAARYAQEAESIGEEIVDLIRSLPQVQYTFTTAHADDAPWNVVRVELTEGVSMLYRGIIELASVDAAADPEQLLGCDAVLVMKRGDLDTYERRVCGVIDHVERLHSTSSGHYLVRVRLVPAMELLAHRVNCRVFQDQNVHDIVNTVLTEGLQGFQRDIDWSGVQATYNPREYCVQYRESDLDFVMRMLEDAGIAFYFTHIDDREKLWLVDANTAYTAICTMDAATSVPFHARQDEVGSTESVHALEWQRTLRSTSVVHRDYDWSRPVLDITRESRGQDDRQRDREVFAYPDVLMSGWQSDHYGQDDGAARAAMRHDELVMRSQRAVGNGIVTTFMPGQTFTLSGHENDALNQQYVITRVTHHGEKPETLIHAVAHAGQPHRPTYRNTFECIPVGVAFRPLRTTTRPRVHGTLPARVVGPLGDEIHTDLFGRVKVQFYWDRVGTFDEHSSCYLRTMQSWSGGGFGSVFVPRIGMEVVVDFYEGDPDRPIVIGCVYNGDNRPPHLPDRPMRTTLKTRSTPSSGAQDAGFNELYFDDDAGSEEVKLHAQHDLNEVVLNDHTTRVGNDQWLTVTGKQVEEVDKDQLITVKGGRNKNVKKDESNVIEGARTEYVTKDENITIHGNRTETVDHDESVTITGKRTEEISQLVQQKMHNDRVVKVDGNDRLEIGADRTEWTHGSSTVSTDGIHKIQQGNTTLTFQSGNVDLNADGHVTIVRGGATVNIGTDGAVTVQTSGMLRLRAADCEFKMQDGRVAIVATQGIALVVAGSTISADPSGVTVSGTAVTSTAGGLNTISGATVKLN